MALNLVQPLITIILLWEGHHKLAEALGFRSFNDFRSRLLSSTYNGGHEQARMNLNVKPRGPGARNIEIRGR